MNIQVTYQDGNTQTLPVLASSVVTFAWNEPGDSGTVVLSLEGVSDIALVGDAAPSDPPTELPAVDESLAAPTIEAVSEDTTAPEAAPVDPPVAASSDVSSEPPTSPVTEPDAA